jgi:hypothetical protein
VGQHYFLMRAKDDSKTYSPESQVVFDIPTAVAFFGEKARAATLEKVHQMALALVSEWNRHFASPDKASIYRVAPVRAEPLENGPQ